MNPDAIKKFFALHVEKLILVVLMIVSLAFIYSGTQQENFQAKLTPNQLAKRAVKVKNDIGQDHIEEIVASLPPEESESYTKKVSKIQKPISANSYGPVVYELRSLDYSTPRRDPTLLAPIQIQVVGVLGALAINSKGTRNPFAILQNATPPTPPKKRSRRSKPRRNNPRENTPAQGRKRRLGGIQEYLEQTNQREARNTRRTPVRSPLEMKLHPDHNQGYRPGSGKPSKANRVKVIPKSAHFLAGTAAVPHRQLVARFRDALKGAAEYDPERDRPRYLGYEVQRADVTNKIGVAIQESDWVQACSWRKLFLRAKSQWAGFAPEIIEPEYRDPFLTFVIPPLLIQDYTHFAVHPLIPMGTIQNPSRLSTDDGQEDPEFSEPEFKMVRFYDFSENKKGPQVNRDYVYRVRILVEDPNFPEDIAMQPPLRYLDSGVFQRVRPKTKQSEVTGKRDFLLAGPWSETSPPARLPSGSEIYVGSITPAESRPMNIKDRQVDYLKKAAFGKIILTRWQERYATYFPFSYDALEGNVLKAKQQTEIVDPLTMVIKKKLARPTNMDTLVVLDVSGGEPFKITEDKKETQPGLVLMMDKNGKLLVRDETTDLRSFRRHTYADSLESNKNRRAPNQGFIRNPGEFSREIDPYTFDRMPNR